jgi:hypothetical protein
MRTNLHLQRIGGGRPIVLIERRYQPPGWAIPYL